MIISNDQKRAFRHDMAYRLIEAGLTDGAKIKDSIEVLEQFIFMLAEDAGSGEAEKVSEDDKRIQFLSQYLGGVKEAGVTYDEAIKLKSINNIDEYLRIAREDFLKVCMITNTGLSGGKIGSRS